MHSSVNSERKSSDGGWNGRDRYFRPRWVNGGGSELCRTESAVDRPRQPWTLQRSIGGKWAAFSDHCQWYFEECAVRDKTKATVQPNSATTRWLEAALSAASRTLYGSLRPFSDDVDGVKIHPRWLRIRSVSSVAGELVGIANSDRV